VHCVAWLSAFVPVLPFSNVTSFATYTDVVLTLGLFNYMLTQIWHFVKNISIQFEQYMAARSAVMALFASELYKA